TGMDCRGCPHRAGRDTYAVGDLHSEVTLLQRLVAAFAPGPQDRPIFLGPNWIRGEDSVETARALLARALLAPCVFLAAAMARAGRRCGPEKGSALGGRHCWRGPPRCGRPGGLRRGTASGRPLSRGDPYWYWWPVATLSGWAIAEASPAPCPLVAR